MKKIVTIGGGAGSYTILSGLKNIPDISISALVAMSDNGGSTGVLRDELGVLPTGDVRQCLVALSEHTDIVRKLMGYRFSEGTTLSGHNFGNIFLAALEKVTGSFVEGVEIASEILKVRGSVIPITKDNADLCMQLTDGTILLGQVNVADADFSKSSLEEIFYKNRVTINPRAEKALLEADYILIGPGNYYCSVLPNLIVDGFNESITKTNAKIILPVNLTNKHGQTINWKVSDYVKDIEGYLNRPVDIILVNNESPTKEQIEKYKLKEGDGVLVADDFEDIRVAREPLLSTALIEVDKTDKRQAYRSFIRHDSKKLADCITKIIAS